MWFGVITLFPEVFATLNASIPGRALEQNLIQLHCWNPRSFSHNKHRNVDDRPYGGGPGMVMSYQPLHDAIQAAKQAAPSPAYTVYLSPQGKTLTQAKLQELKEHRSLILIAGRYEGIDERVIANDVDEELSIGDYVVSGGELPAMIIIDALTRLLPNALGDEESALQDSFMNGLLDYPHYTRPEAVENLQVPAVLLEGNHAAIQRWRLKQSLGRTWLRRPDLIARKPLTREEQMLLNEFVLEYERQESLP